MAEQKGSWDRKWQRGRVSLTLKSGAQISFRGRVRCRRTATEVTDYDIDTDDTVLVVPHIDDIDAIIAVPIP